MVGSSGPLETATTLCGNTRAACAQRRRVRRQRMHAARSKPGGLMLARCEQELCLVVVTSQVKTAAAKAGRRTCSRRICRAGVEKIEQHASCKSLSRSRRAAAADRAAAGWWSELISHARAVALFWR